MKKIFYFIIILSVANTVFAQNKKLTLYYPDSTKIVNIAGLDSMVIFICGSSKVSYGGKDYNTVLIGNQCWLKENLDVGVMIQGSQNSTNNGVIEKYCYNNDTSNCNTYGGLYQWREAMQYITNEGTRGICPEGWHIPAEVEFAALKTFVGGDGNSLKAIDQGTGAGQGTDLYGFSALLAGNKETNHIFLDIGRIGHFWSSTSSNTNVPHYYLWNDRSDFTQHWGVYSTYGFSVRCIKDN
ncbi:MAG: hypothetical protein KGZ85_16585 [Ignavibacterium sp.]|nr:hypothetical protein [Ignavibacterium sp.]